MTAEKHRFPSIENVRIAQSRLSPHIHRTPTVQWNTDLIRQVLGAKAIVTLKLEVFQKTGTFKARAALNNLLSLGTEARVTTISAGNHAIAVAYAASVVGADAKVVMSKSANPARVAATKAYGADVLLEPSGEVAYRRVMELVRDENRTFVHPFDGFQVAEATGGVALEFFEDVGELDALVVAVGGGGLAAGVAAVAKEKSNNCVVFGVEPATADLMRRSLAVAMPLEKELPGTIADSLSPPLVTEYTLSACKYLVDEIVTVNDDEIAAAMALLFTEMKLAVEPACAVTTAAMFGPLRSRLQGKKIGLILCGSNIEFGSYEKLTKQGFRALESGVLGPDIGYY